MAWWPAWACLVRILHIPIWLRSPARRTAGAVIARLLSHSVPLIISKTAIAWCTVRYGVKYEFGMSDLGKISSVAEFRGGSVQSVPACIDMTKNARGELHNIRSRASSAFMRSGWEQNTDYYLRAHGIRNSDQSIGRQYGT